MGLRQSSEHLLAWMTVAVPRAHRNYGEVRVHGLKQLGDGGSCASVVGYF